MIISNNKEQDDKAGRDIGGDYVDRGFLMNMTNTHTGKATKGKVQDIGEVNKVMPLPLPSSDRVRG